MNKKVIIIIVVLLVVVAAVGSYFLFFMNKEKPPVVSYYVPGDFFVTNVKDSNYLLKTTIVLELNVEDENEFLTKRNHIIRDVIVFSLREKNEEELRSTGIQEELRKEIVDKLNEKLGVDYIVTLYFNDYVLQ
jgi:flagellar basal body-associated protein FliL